MIFIRCIPWRILALPTPIGVLLVTIVPAPFVLIAAGLKRLRRVYRRQRALAFVRARPQQLFCLYTQRPDSAALLSTAVLPRLQATAVLVDDLEIVDTAYGALRGLLPQVLGNSFPLLLRADTLRAGKIGVAVMPLHDCVYTETLAVRETDEIIARCKLCLAE